MGDHFFQRFRWWILGFALLITPPIFYGAMQALASNINDPLDWLPEHFDETQRLMQFGHMFGTDSFLLISWPNCTLDDPRVLALVERLDRIEFDGRPMFADVTSGPEAISSLTAPPLNLSDKQAARRLQGMLIGADGNSTCIAVTMQQFTPAAQHFAYDAVWQAIDDTPGITEDSVKLAGTAFDGVFIDRASQQGLEAIIAACYAVCFLLLLISFRSIAVAGAIMAVSILNQYLAMALVWANGGHMDSILLVAPSLVYVLSISTGVHLANYYRDALHLHPAATASTYAVRFGAMPCMVASITTAVGMLSLTSSYLAPVGRFGFYAAAGVLFATATLLLILPVLFSFVYPKRWLKAEDPEFDETQIAAQLHGQTLRWKRVAGWVATSWLFIFFAVAVLSVLGWHGLARLQASARIHDMFADDARVIQDYAWLEQAIGPMIPIEVVLQFPNAADSRTLDQMRWVAQVQSAVQNTPEVSLAYSALNFAPGVSPRPQGRISNNAVAGARVLEKKLTASLPQLDAARMHHSGSDFQSWRISGRIDSDVARDMKQALVHVREAVDPLLQQAQAEFPGAQVLYSGTMPILEKTQEQLLTDLTVSFLLAFAFITVSIAVMLLVHAAPEFREASGFAARARITARCVVAALLAMIPNVLPCIVVFGAMGWLGIKIEIGTVMTATVAMGVTVDDTLHFVTWFRRRVLEGGSRLSGVAYAFRHCGAAMLQTTAVCSLGLLGFTLSEFGPMQRFAWLMFFMLSMGLLGDLIVLPAILYSPLGRFFTPRGTPQRKEAAATADAVEFQSGPMAESLTAALGQR